ncbi:hypothetical protein VB776_16390 [Arcicella sp. DC2W]|uniref:Uncharacterized protein n=1 Tax=Arcicella gelida TaxID=2984195 RepID=A0ABU5S7Q6_9BACT|nr:hypothetical protein [Arcicella sp. DC2W]MEA5404513.1 hypothetical protein [Arcicella sp. DC2W]
MKKLLTFLKKNWKTTVLAWIIGLALLILGFVKSNDELMIYGITTIISGTFSPDPQTVLTAIKSLKK